MNDNKPKHKDVMFTEKVRALSEKIVITFEGEEINVCMCSLMCVLLAGCEKISPEGKSGMVACLKECIGALGKPHPTYTIH